jgi:sec-independent protein translocase protein TatA
MFEGLFQPFHLLVILIVVLIIFGPGKLPEVGSAIGKAIRGFKKAMSDVDINQKDESTQHKPVDIKKPEDQNQNIDKEI